MFRLIENGPEHLQVRVDQRVIYRDVEIVVRVMRSVVHPRAERLADDLLLPFEHPAELVKVDPTQDFEVVFENPSQRVLDSEIRAFGFANLGPQQLVRSLDWVGRMSFELRN